MVGMALECLSILEGVIISDYGWALGGEKYTCKTPNPLGVNVVCKKERFLGDKGYLRFQYYD